MRKKITSVILFILITLIATNIYAAITANATLTLSADKVKAGEEVTVTLRMKDIDAGSDGLMGAQLKIDYDKNIFETLTEDKIQGLSGLADNYNESNKGNILIVSAMSGIKAESDFVKVTFKVKENAELKNTTITFQDIEVFNLEKSNIGSKSVSVEIVDKDEVKQESTPTPTPTSKPDEGDETKPTPTPADKPNGGSESTPTPSTKPTTTPTSTATSKPNSGENKNDVPITNINTNTSNGSGTANNGNTSSGTTIKGSTTSSSSLPKAGIGSTITVLTVVAVIIGIVSYIKLRNYREI